MQGGPCCDSLFGMMAENGPFRLWPNGTLTLQTVRWTREFNMLWVTQPALTGFSYATKNATLGDRVAAVQNAQFLERWLEAFPQYTGRVWYWSESFGGIFVPMLMQQLVRTASTALKRVAGFMLGNPSFRCELPPDTYFSGLYYHGLVSFSSMHNWTSNGCSTQVKLDLLCQSIFDDAVDAIGVVSQELGQTSGGQIPQLNPDNLYFDFCTGNSTLAASQSLNGPLCHSVVDDITTYFNSEAFKRAFHVRNLSTVWSVCSDACGKLYQHDGGPMAPVYDELFAKVPALRILIYSGDVDVLTVPLATTRFCFAQLNRTVVTPFRPWLVNGNTAGYIEHFDRFALANIKGSGHEAMLFLRLPSWSLTRRFLLDETIGVTPPRPNRQARPPRCLRELH